MRKGARTVELSLHRWPHAGRAFRRASVPPLLGGLLTFSLSLVAVGIVVYAGAVPSLAEQSPLVRQWAGADRARVLGPDAPLMGAHGLSATGDDPSGAGGANGLGAASVASDDRTLAAAAGAPSDPADLLLLGGRSASLLGGSGFAAPTSTGAGVAHGPSCSSGSETPASSDNPNSSGSNATSSGSANGGGGASSGNSSGGGSASGEPSGGGSSSGGSSGGNAVAPTPSEPEPDPEPTIPVEAGGPVPEDMEQRICSTLRSEHDVFKAEAAKVYQCADDYERLCMTRPQQPRIEAARTVSSLLREVQLADSDMMMEVGYACNRDDGTMYGASRYSGNFSQMHQSYGDLINLLYELDNAWSGNCYFEDPAANADYWSGRVTRSAVTGRMAYLGAYEAHVGGARP